MPLEGGLYQWAKFGFNEFTGFIVAWNLWLLGITVMAGTGLVIATNFSYALGPAWSWLPQNRVSGRRLNGTLIAALILVAIRGLSLGKWVHNAGAILMLVTYGALIALPFLAVATGQTCPPIIRLNGRFRARLSSASTSSAKWRSARSAVSNTSPSSRAKRARR